MEGLNFYQKCELLCINDLMSTIKAKVARRLQQKNSISTEGTIEGNGFSGIQINVRQPKAAKTYEISEAIRMKDQAIMEDSSLLRSSKNSDILLGIPLLQKKRDEGSVFDTKNIKSTIKDKSNSKGMTSFSREEVRETNSTNNSNILTFLIDEETPNQDYLFHDDGINNTVLIKSSTSIRNEGFGFENPQEFPKQGFLKSKEKSTLKKYMSLNQFPSCNEESKINISIDEDLEAEAQATTNTIKINMKKNDHEKEKKPLINKENMLTRLKKTEPSGRMTLRDYMYQTQVSSKKMLKSIKEIEEQIEKKQSKPEVHKLHKKMSIASPQYKNAKYGITAGEMYIELKNDICSEISQMICRLKEVQQRLRDPSKDIDNPTSEDLLLLYNTRKTLKDQAHKQIISVQQSLSTLKRNPEKAIKELQFQEI